MLWAPNTYRYSTTAKLLPYVEMFVSGQPLLFVNSLTERRRKLR
jgi:hypothetical protein